MKYFIDLGTHLFGGLREFTEKLNLNKEWIIYSYEGNRDVFEQSLPIKVEMAPNYLRLYHYNYAVMDYDGTVTFNKQLGAWDTEGNYLDHYTCGANSLEENPLVDPGNGYRFNIVQEVVKCIDFNNVINSITNTDKKAEIYIKCDIEGSEFKILPKLLKNKNIKYIKEIHIEWHERFWMNNEEEYKKRCFEKDNITNELKQLNIGVYLHH